MSVENETNVVDWTEITLTSRCNQRCFFCYEEARGNSTDPDIEHIKGLLRETRKQSDQVVLCGREVLLRRDVIDIIEYGTSLGLRMVVFTNGQALHRPGLVAELADAGSASLAISYHFPDNEAFERGARVAGKCFDLIHKGFANLRQYNEEHADAPLPFSVEIDVHTLNAGRLAEMRDTLRELLGDKFWKLRIASLTPTRIYDIGLDNVLTPFLPRREEIAEFVKTQPETLPLAFVKIPLCMMPAGTEHACLDVQYVYEGSVLTFNHAESDKITVDTDSISANRNMGKTMRRHPYRWICRGCNVATMCRLERMDWFEKGFAASKVQRPEPYRPEGSAPSVVDLLPIPTRPGSTEAIFQKLGGDPKAAEAVDVVRNFLDEQRYPEERILERLSALDGEVKLLDAWAQDDPYLVVRLGVGEEQVTLHLGQPDIANGDTKVAHVVDCLSVRVLDDEVAPTTLRKALEALAVEPFAPLAEWDEDDWFDLHVGRTLRAASMRFGKALWVDVGGIGQWRTTAIEITDSRRLDVSLTHPGGASATLRWWCEAFEGDLERVGKFNFEVEIEGGNHDICSALFAFAGTAVAGEEFAPPVSSDRAPVRHARLEQGAWEVISDLGNEVDDEGKRDHEDGDEGAESRARSSWLDLNIRPKEGGHAYLFHVAEPEPEQKYFKKVGRTVLWYSHKWNSHMDRDKGARAWTHVLLRVMKNLEAQGLSADNAHVWQTGIEEQAVARGLEQRYEWVVTWQGRAPV